MGEMINANKSLVGKPDGKRPLVILTNRWEDDIKMGLGEIEFGVWTRFIWLRIWTGVGLL
jgi:hypothetical protein